MRAVWANISIMRHIFAVINIYAEINYLILKWPPTFYTRLGPRICEIHSGYWLYPRASCGWVFFFFSFCICILFFELWPEWLVDWLNGHGLDVCTVIDTVNDIRIMHRICCCPVQSAHVCVCVCVCWLNRKRKWQQALCAVPLGAICICILHICCLFSHCDCHKIHCCFICCCLPNGKI